MDTPKDNTIGQIGEIEVNTEVFDVSEELDRLVAREAAKKRVYSIVLKAPSEEIRENKERESTKRNKTAFLEFYPQVFHIAATCKKIEIAESTYYEWMKNDPEFASAFFAVKQKRKAYVEDKLFKLIQEGDGPSVRYWLDRQHEEYKPKSETTIIPGQSYTAMLWEEARRRREARQLGKDEYKVIEAENGTNNTDKQ